MPACRPRSARFAGTRKLSRWIVRHRPRRRDPGPVRVDGQRLSAEAEAARDPRHRVVLRSHVPHQPLGLRLHRRGPGATGRQAGRHHRNRRDGGAVRAAPGARGGPLSVFQRTPSSVDVRANRPTDPQWAAGLPPGWQRRRIENFQLLTAAGRPTRTWSPTPGPASPRPCCVTDGDGPQHRARRFRQDGGGPRASRRDRRRSRHRRGAQTVVRLLLQAAVLSRRLPGRRSTATTSLWSTPTARACSASPNAASWSTGSSTSSTA